jgi:hypothetical protein
VAVDLEDGLVVPLGGVAVGQEVAVQLGHRAMQGDPLVDVGLDVEPLRQQGGEVVVVGVFLEQDAGAHEGVAVGRLGRQRHPQRRQRAVTVERPVHQRDRGEVGQARACGRAGLLPRLGKRRLGDVDPQLPAQGGPAPARQRRDVPGDPGHRVLEGGDGAVEIADLGQGLAGASQERRRRARVGRVQVGDGPLERGQLAAAPARRTSDSRWNRATRWPGSRSTTAWYTARSSESGQAGPLAQPGLIEAERDQVGRRGRRRLGRRLEPTQPGQLGPARARPGQVRALEGADGGQAVRIGRDRRLPRHHGGAEIRAQLGVDVAQALVRLGHRALVGPRLGGAQLGQGDRGDRRRLAPVAGDAQQRLLGDRVLRAQREGLAEQHAGGGAVAACGRQLGVAHQAGERVGAGGAGWRRGARRDLVEITQAGVAPRWPDRGRRARPGCASRTWPSSCTARAASSATSHSAAAR